LSILLDTPLPEGEGILGSMTQVVLTGISTNQDRSSNLPKRLGLPTSFRRAPS